MVGFSYLLIGLFVYFRRGSAHKAQHFYILCLTSFIFLCFHYTGKLNTFDKVIYFGNVAAGLLAPTIFLHFCLTFPEPRKWLRGAAARRCCICRPPSCCCVYLGVRLGRADGARAPGGTALDAGPRVDGVLDGAVYRRRRSR